MVVSEKAVRPPTWRQVNKNSYYGAELSLISRKLTPESLEIQVWNIHECPAWCI